jgi:peptide/nickel transport system permease protein
VSDALGLARRSDPAVAALDLLDESADRGARRNRLWRSLRRDRPALVGAGMLVLMALVAVGGPLLAPHDPLAQDLNLRLRPPLWEARGVAGHLLGTDHVGRDVLSRIIYGARVSLLVGFAAVAISGTLGVVLGLLAGFYGGAVDAVVMRLAEVQLAFPFILLAIAVVAFVGGGLVNVVLVLGLAGWMGYARVVRGQVLSAKEREYVHAARALGVDPLRLMRVHILPNVVGPAIVLGTFAVAATIIAESSLTFLGLGVEPTTPSWGSMLADGRAYLTSGWWVATFPGLAIVLTVLSVNLLGDWLRDYLDPTVQL